LEPHQRPPPMTPSSALAALSMLAASTAYRFPEVGTTGLPRLLDPIERNLIGDQAP
jgi:hypothetical protein